MFNVFHIILYYQGWFFRCWLRWCFRWSVLCDAFCWVILFLILRLPQWNGCSSGSHCGCFDGRIFCFVFFHMGSWVRHGTEMCQFLRISCLSLQGETPYYNRRSMTLTSPWTSIGCLSLGVRFRFEDVGRSPKRRRCCSPDVARRAPLSENYCW